MKEESEFVIYVVTYLTPKFGSEGEFNPQEWQMMVSTRGGKKDAQETCERFHRGCKVINVATRLEDRADVKGIVPKKGKGKSK